MAFSTASVDFLLVTENSAEEISLRLRENKKTLLKRTLRRRGCGMNC